jgi:hypothetical protein
VSNSQWEIVVKDQNATDTERLRVDGGWLYRTRIKAGPNDHPSIGVAMCFVPEAKKPTEKPAL